PSPRFTGPGARRDPLPYPTRRSSDLIWEFAKIPGLSLNRASCLCLAATTRSRIRALGSAGVAPPRSVGLIAGTCTWRSIRSRSRSEEHTSELQSREKLVCRLLLEKKQ